MWVMATIFDKAVLALFPNDLALNLITKARHYIFVCSCIFPSEIFLSPPQFNFKKQAYNYPLSSFLLFTMKLLKS